MFDEEEQGEQTDAEENDEAGHADEERRRLESRVVN